MIVDLIFGVLFTILNAVFGLIPEFTIIGGPGTGCGTTGYCGWDVSVTVGNWLVVLDSFLPVAFLFWGIFTIFGARVFVSVVQFARWLWDVLPFKAS